MNLTRATLQSFARYFAGLLFGVILAPMISRNMLSADLAVSLRAATEDGLVLGLSSLLLFVGPLVWAWWKNVATKAKLAIALYLDPATAIPADIQTQSNDMTSGEKLALAKAL